LKEALKMTTPNISFEHRSVASSDEHRALGVDHVFTGDLRIQAKEVLSTMLAQKRFTPVMEILQKDPSLALETIPVKSNKKRRDPERIDFPFACVEIGFADGIEFAIQHGYPINKMSPGRETLLAFAIRVHYLHRENSSVVSLLLSMGADPNISTPYFSGRGRNLLVLMQKTLNGIAHGIKPNFELLNALLDAKVDVKPFDSERICPLSELVKYNDEWKDVAIRPQLTQFMDRLVKAGCNVNSRSGPRLYTPIEVAVNELNIHGIVALVRLGAEPKVSNKSLFEFMARSRALKDAIPLVQSALMERTIAISLSSIASNPAPIDSPQSENQPRRRRMSGI
jgi:ankyrin repeat protein